MAIFSLSASALNHHKVIPEASWSSFEGDPLPKARAYLVSSSSFASASSAFENLYGRFTKSTIKVSASFVPLSLENCLGTRFLRVNLSAIHACNNLVCRHVTSHPMSRATQLSHLLASRASGLVTQSRSEPIGHRLTTHLSMHCTVIGRACYDRDRCRYAGEAGNELESVGEHVDQSLSYLHRVTKSRANNSQ